MKIPITELAIPSYNAGHKGRFFPITFNIADIHAAIKNEQWELRSFQACFNELQTEWDSADLQSSVDLQKQYHVKRIATIAEKGIWREPLLLYNDRKTILDGGHRLWAMHSLNIKEVEIIVIDKTTLTKIERKGLWDRIGECCGDLRCALEQLGIRIVEE